MLALGRAARAAFAQGQIEDGIALVEERGRLLAGLTALEIGHGTMAQLQNEEGQLLRSAQDARDSVGSELRRLSRPQKYPVSG